MSSLNLTLTEKTIINAIRLYGISKKTTIAELTGIPWSSTVNAIKNLLDKDFLLYSDNDKNEVKLNPDLFFVLGVSLGTSHIKVTVLDSIFHIVKKELIKQNLNMNSFFISEFWDKNGFYEHTTILKNSSDEDALWCATTPDRDLLNIRELLSDICKFCVELKSNGFNIQAICISFPGIINNKTNTIIESRNLDFQLSNANIRNIVNYKALKELDDNNINIYLEHNVKAATVAEVESKKILSRHSDIQNLAVLYLGKGLGIGYILNNKLYRGSKCNNAAGQLGHIKVNYINEYNSTCSCGRTGCLEQLLRDTFENENGKLDIKKMTGKQLAEWLSNNPSNAKRFIDYLIISIYNVYMLLDIDTFVLSGKLSEIYMLLEEEFQQKLIESNCTNLSLLPSDLDEYSASIGSAMCAYYNYLELPYEWL